MGAYCLLSILGCGSPQIPQDKFARKLDSLNQKIREVKQKKINLILSRFASQGRFNANVLILEKGKEFLKRSYGMADFRTKKPLTAQTAFYIGSLSQSFTAVAALKLIAKGKVKLDAPLTQFYESFPYSEITLRHLLTHTSGLPDYIDTFSVNAEGMFTYANNQNVVAWILDESPELSFVSGTNWELSHTNYVLLANIIEKITKEPFAEYLKNQIFKPLGLKNTFLSAEKENNQARAFGFLPDNETLADENPLDRIYGDRGIYSSVEDLQKWDEILTTQSILPKILFELMFNPVELYNGGTYPYGMGWYLQPHRQKSYVQSHWLGFKSAMYRLQSDGYTVIILCNNQSPVFSELVQMIEQVLLGLTYKISA